MLTEEFTRQLVERLKETDAFKIILFGSHAYGESGPDSDIDLLVVTEDDSLPKDFAEEDAIYLRGSNSITEIEKKIPIDLIVHAKAMHRKFIEMGSMFSRKIVDGGKVLYEKLTEEWLKAAKDDLDVIERIIKDHHLSHIVAFHAQQSLENLFKAVIEEYGCHS